MSESSRAAHRFLDALERRDSDAIADLISDDVVEVLPLAASGDVTPAAVFEGRDAVMRVQGLLVSSFSVVEFDDRQTTEGDDGRTVFVEAIGRRVQDGTGRVYVNRYALKFEFRDGLIRRITEYSNPVAFAKFFDQPIG